MLTKFYIELSNDGRCGGNYKLRILTIPNLLNFLGKNSCSRRKHDH
jgi:hypothetical protein